MSLKSFVCTWVQYSFCRESWAKSQLPLTFRWFNAAGALLIAANQGDPNCLGGIRPGEAQEYRQILSKWWAITDHGTAYITMSHLLQAETRVRFERSMQAYHSHRFELPSDKTRTDWAALQRCWEKYGADAVLAWDLCRAVIVSTWCHICGYLSLEELMQIAIRAGEMLQHRFSGWEETMESYLCGFSYWSNPRTPEEKQEYRLRVHLYHTLQGRTGPFAATPFVVGLSPHLTDAEKSQIDIIYQ